MMDNEAFEQARADLCTAYEWFNAVTEPMLVDAAIFNLYAKELVFDNLLKEAQKELRKVATSKTPLTLKEKLMSNFIPKREVV